MGQILIFHNIISPYKVLLFNELNILSHGRVHVVFFAETSDDREWNIDYDKIRFPYTLLNKGALNRVSNVQLVRQAREFLLEYNEDISTVLVGEYIRPIYWYALLWGRMHGKTNGGILESHQADHQRVWLKELVKRGFFSLCDYVLAAGQKHKAYAVALGMSPDAVAVMGGVGGVNHPLYDACVADWQEHGCARRYLAELCRLPEDKNYFIYVGRFSPEKNLFRLLEAYAAVSEGCPDWGLLLVGGGPQEQDIKARIRQSKIKNVYFPGFIQQDRLAYYYLLSQVFILPSLSEPWGLVVDEAVYLGKPVIASAKCGCVPDIVQNEQNGWVVDPMSVEDIRAAMLEAVADGDRLSSYGRASARIGRQSSPASSAQNIWALMGPKGI